MQQHWIIIVTRQFITMTVSIRHATTVPELELNQLSSHRAEVGGCCAGLGLILKLIENQCNIKNIIFRIDNRTAIDNTRSEETYITTADADLYEKVYQKKRKLKTNINCEWIPSHQDKR